jgi:hypothetical protein
VSPLLPDRLRVMLAPTGIRLARERGWPKRRCIDSAVLPCAPGEGVLWQRGVETLQAALAEPRWQGAPLVLMLSDRLLRYQLLAGQAELGSLPERQGYARFHFRQVYGPLVDDWEIRVDDPLPGKPIVACAMDRALASSLETLAKTAGTRISRMTPGFAAAFNRMRRVLSQASGDTVVLAVLEPQSLCFAVIADGRWLALRQRSVAGDPDEALRHALDQERLMADAPFTEATVYVVTYPDADGRPDEALGTVWTVHRLAMKGEIPEWSDLA